MEQKEKLMKFEEIPCISIHRMRMEHLNDYESISLGMDIKIIINDKIGDRINDLIQVIPRPAIPTKLHLKLGDIEIENFNEKTEKKLKESELTFTAEMGLNWMREHYSKSNDHEDDYCEQMRHVNYNTYQKSIID